MCVWIQQSRDVISCSPVDCLRGWGNSERDQRPHPINVLYDNDCYDDDDDDADKYDDNDDDHDGDNDDDDDGGGGEDDAAAALISCSPEHWFICHPIYLYSKSAGFIVTLFICIGNLCICIALCMCIVNLMVLLPPYLFE